MTHCLRVERQMTSSCVCGLNLLGTPLSLWQLCLLQGCLDECYCNMSLKMSLCNKSDLHAFIRIPYLISN